MEAVINASHSLSLQELQNYMKRREHILSGKFTRSYERQMRQLIKTRSRKVFNLYICGILRKNLVQVEIAVKSILVHIC